MSAATGATTPLRIIGVIDSKTTPHRPVVEVDYRSIEVEGIFLPRNNLDSMLVELSIARGVELSVEAQRILKTAASTTANAHAEERFRLKLLRLHNAVDFLGRKLGQGNSHRGNSLDLLGLVSPIGENATISSISLVHYRALASRVPRCIMFLCSTDRVKDD